MRVYNRPLSATEIQSDMNKAVKTEKAARAAEAPRCPLWSLRPPRLWRFRRSRAASSRRFRSSSSPIVRIADSVGGVISTSTAAGDRRARERQRHALRRHDRKRRERCCFVHQPHDHRIGELLAQVHVGFARIGDLECVCGFCARCSKPASRLRRSQRSRRQPRRAESPLRSSRASCSAMRRG